MRNHSLPGHHTEVIFCLSYLDINSTSSRHVGVCKVPVGFSFGIFLSRRGLPFERDSTLWVHPLGNPRRAVRQGESRKPLFLYNVPIPVFTVVEVGNQTRSIHSPLDLVDIFTHDLSPVFRIPSFLSRNRYTRAVVLKLPSLDLYLRAVQVLERRVPPILDPATIPKFPARRTGPCVIVILFDSIRPLVHQPSLR